MLLSSRLKICLPLAVLCAGVLAGGKPTQAQALQTTFNLTGVTFVIQKFNGQPYLFNNTIVGSGQFVFLQFPVTINTPGGIDTSALSYDYAITFAPGLTQSTRVTGGTFGLTGTDGFFSGEYTGIVTGGAVTPQAAPEPGVVTGLLVGLGLLGVFAAPRRAFPG